MRKENTFGVMNTVDAAIATRFPSANEPDLPEILENELPVEVRVNNYLLAFEPVKLSEMLDIPAPKCLDYCREMRGLATSIADQIKLWPEKRDELRVILETYRKNKIKEIFAEKQRHD